MIPKTKAGVRSLVRPNAIAAAQRASLCSGQIGDHRVRAADRDSGYYLHLLGSLHRVLPVISAAAWDPKRSVVSVSLLKCGS